MGGEFVCKSFIREEGKETGELEEEEEEQKWKPSKGVTSGEVPA